MNKQEIIDQVERFYPLKIKTAEPLFDGPDNLFLKITTTDDQLYAVRSSKRSTDTGVEFEAEWISYLSSRGLTVPKVLPTKTGAACLVLPQTAITVFEFIAGRELSANEHNPQFSQAAAEAGSALAALHNATAGHRINRPRKRTIFTELQRLQDKAAPVSQTVPGGSRLVKEVNDYLDRAQSWSGPKVLVHNDYHIGNLIFDSSNRVKAIIDFDWACEGPALKDLGHALALWSRPGQAEQFFAEVWDNFLDHYNQTADQPINYDSDLKFWLQFSCLSDTCTWITDNLEQDIIKPVSSCYSYRRFQYFSN